MRVTITVSLENGEVLRTCHEAPRINYEVDIPKAHIDKIVSKFMALMLMALHKEN